MWLWTQHRSAQSTLLSGGGERQGAFLPMSPPTARDQTHGTALSNRRFAQRGSFGTNTGLPQSWHSLNPREVPLSRAQGLTSGDTAQQKGPRARRGHSSDIFRAAATQGELGELHAPATQRHTYCEMPAPVPGQVTRTAHMSGKWQTTALPGGAGQAGLLRTDSAMAHATGQSPAERQRGPRDLAAMATAAVSLGSLQGSARGAL